MARETVSGRGMMDRVVFGLFDPKGHLADQGMSSREVLKQKLQQYSARIEHQGVVSWTTSGLDSVEKIHANVGILLHQTLDSAYGRATDRFLQRVESDYQAFLSLLGVLHLPASEKAHFIRVMTVSTVTALVEQSNQQRIAYPKRILHINMAARLVFRQGALRASRIEGVEYDPTLIHRISHALYQGKEPKLTLKTDLSAFASNPT